MSLKRLLLPVSSEDDIAYAADLAFLIAKKHGAQVQGLFAQEGEPKHRWMHFSGLSGTEVDAVMSQDMRNAADSKRKATAFFRYHQDRYQGVDAECLSTIGNVAASIIDHVYCSDMAVLPSVPKGKNRYWDLLSDQLLDQSARPVLIAPNRPISSKVGHRVVVAWNECAESARAVAAAIPLIEKANSVLVVNIGESEYWKSSGRLKDFLSLHGKRVENKVLDPAEEKVGKMLIDVTAEQQGGVLVMGAFGHRRWREEMFGGVTDYVLNNSDVPVLMMH